MKIKPLLYTSLVLMMPLLAGADTVQIVQGTPGDNTFLPATPASPSFPNRIDFSGLSSQITNPNCYSDFGTDCPTFNSSTYASQGATIFSPDGLLIYPASTQTAGGIELFDEGTNGDGDGTANITISLTGGVDDLAVGISDFDDPVSLTIEALGASGNVLASMDVSAAEEAATAGTGNTYFIAEDTTQSIYGLEILQTDQTYGSGLALAEVEYTTETPEPSTLLFLIGGGLAIIGSARRRKKA